jgi:hypothetical protein
MSFMVCVWLSGDWPGNSAGVRGVCHQSAGAQAVWAGFRAAAAGFSALRIALRRGFYGGANEQEQAAVDR